MTEPTYRPRNDFVLCKLAAAGPTEAGLVMPDNSPQGKHNVVVACGPDVEDLQPGDRVEVTGKQGVDWSFLPNSNSMFVTRQDNIVLVVTEETC